MADRLIRLSDVLAELDRHAKGSVQLGGQSFRTIQLHEAETAINALPASAPTVQEAAKVPEIAAMLSAFRDLEKQANITASHGAVTGPHWTHLNIVLLKSRAAIRAIAGESQ